MSVSGTYPVSGVLGPAMPSLSRPRNVRGFIICTSDAQVMNDDALESLRREDSNGVIISIPVSRCQSVERILSLVSLDHGMV
jgi:hypothetical protein